jgi:hypothetical protein
MSKRTDPSGILTPAGSSIGRAVPTRLPRASRASDGFEGSKTAMLDIVMVALGVGFFVVSIFYVLACERM